MMSNLSCPGMWIQQILNVMALVGVIASVQSKAGAIAFNHADGETWLCSSDAFEDARVDWEVAAKMC